MGPITARRAAEDAALLQAARPVLDALALFTSEVPYLPEVARDEVEYFLGKLVKGIGKAVKSVASFVSKGVKSVANFISTNPIVGTIVSAIPVVGSVVSGAASLLADPPEPSPPPAGSSGGELNSYSLLQIALGLPMDDEKGEAVWKYAFLPPFEERALAPPPNGVGSAGDPKLHYNETSYPSWAPTNRWYVWDWKAGTWRTFQSNDKANGARAQAVRYFNALRDELLGSLNKGTVTVDASGNVQRKPAEPNFLPAPPSVVAPSLVSAQTYLPPPLISSGEHAWTEVEASRVANEALQIYRTYGPDQAIFHIFEAFPPMTFVMGALRRLAPTLLGDVDYYRACAPCRDERGFYGSLPQGKFYHGSAVTAELSRTLGDGVFGQVHLSDMPFRIQVSSEHGDGRARVALAHELGHVANQLYKLGLNHNQVHDLGVFYATEGLPALNAMEAHVSSAPRRPTFTS